MIDADVAAGHVIGGDTTPSSAGATPSSSVSSTAKQTKNIDLLNSSGMGDLKAAKPYKREPLHRSVNFTSSTPAQHTPFSPSHTP